MEEQLAKQADREVKMIERAIVNTDDKLKFQ